MSEYKHKYNYNWKMKDVVFTKDKGNVFSCFACGGGSTLGYKLAGYNVIGFNEIDPRMAECYIKNHNPKYGFVEPIQDFKLREDLPDELYKLDILDASPPCSSYSLLGNREKDWGKEKKFREGQQNQVLDTLFFDLIDLAGKLKSKIVVCENVKGLLIGSAKQYVDKIITEFDKNGYYVTYKLLNASYMGVPQARERVFFFAIRKDLAGNIKFDHDKITPLINMRFNETPIPYSEIRDSTVHDIGLSPMLSKYWNMMKEQNKTGSFSQVHETGSYFGEMVATPNKPLNTITGLGKIYDYEYERKLTTKEFCYGGSYPTDYDFMNNKPEYLIGMSVPPVMMANIIDRLYSEWICNIKVTNKIRSKSKPVNIFDM